MSTELDNDYAEPFDGLTDILSHVVENEDLGVSDESGIQKKQVLGFGSALGF